MDRTGVDFYIRWVGKPVSANPLTHQLWKRAEGERGHVRAVPKGRFTVPDLVGPDDRRLKLFVAAGTGLAPYVSIVRSHLDMHADARLDGFAILHGASYPEELGYRDELEAWRQHGLIYVPTVSRPMERPDWRGVHGRVEDLLLPGRLTETEEALGLQRDELRPDRVAVFVCGLQGTIGRCIERLAPRGFVPEDRRLRTALGITPDKRASLFFEQYDTAPVLDLEDTDNIARITAALRAAT